MQGYAFPPLLFNIVLEVLPTTLDKKRYRINSQDGGVGRYTVPPRTTKIRTTNLKTKTNQNCQKIKLYRSPTTKELKKTHSSRQVGRMEMGSRVERQGPGWQTRHDSGWQSVWPHICLWINQEAQLGSETDHTTQGSSTGK